MNRLIHALPLRPGELRRDVQVRAPETAVLDRLSGFVLVCVDLGGVCTMRGPWWAGERCEEDRGREEGRVRERIGGREEKEGAPICEKPTDSAWST